MSQHLRGIDAGRHPIGRTAGFPGHRHADLLASPADWISPGNPGGWRDAPPPADGGKVVLVDTDHLWGIGGGRDWVWKTFLRGHHPIYMDPLDNDPRHEPARRAMGDTLRYAQRIDLAVSVPDIAVCSSGYALVNRTPGREEILAYLPKGRARVDLSGVQGPLQAEWFEPATGRTENGTQIETTATLVAPWRGEAVLLLACQDS